MSKGATATILSSSAIQRWTNLLGGVDIVGGNHSDTIAIQDASHFNAATYNLSNSTLSRTGMGGASLSQCESINLTAGLGNDSVNLNFGYGSPDATIGGGGGNDAININVDGYNFPAFQNPVSLAGGTGTDSINFTGRPAIHHHALRKFVRQQQYADVLVF